MVLLQKKSCCNYGKKIVIVPREMTGLLIFCYFLSHFEIFFRHIFLKKYKMLHKIHLFLLKGQAKGLSTCLTTFYKPFPTPGTYTFTYMFIYNKNYSRWQSFAKYLLKLQEKKYTVGCMLMNYESCKKRSCLKNSQ